MGFPAEWKEADDPPRTLCLTDAAKSIVAPASRLLSVDVNAARVFAGLS
jgi:hypothetical protein